MNDGEIAVLKELVGTLYWSPDDKTCFKVTRIVDDYDDEGPCAFFQNGKYAALEGCDVRDFVLVTRLK